MHYIPYRYEVQQDTTIRILTGPVDCTFILQDMCDVKNVANCCDSKRGLVL